MLCYLFIAAPANCRTYHCRVRIDVQIEWQSQPEWFSGNNNNVHLIHDPIHFERQKTTTPATIKSRTRRK